MSPRPTRREALLTLVATSGVALGDALPAQELFAPPGPPNQRDIRVLFFNMHLLPAIAQTVAGHRGQDDYRTQAIAAQLHQYDLVGLCEVFEARRRREIVATVQQNSHQAFQWIESPKPSGRHVICGGLLLLSRFPIVGDAHVHTYASASRVLTSGWKADGFAAKGVLHARLRVSEQPEILADCFLTHLESVSSKARAEQIKELAAYVAAHAAPERPLILMGDLNVVADDPAAAPPADSEYRILVNALRLGDRQLVDAWPTLQAGRGGTSDALGAGDCRRIDYIFLSPPRDADGPSWEPTAIQVEPFLDGNVKQGSLSDHAAVACRLQLR